MDPVNGNNFILEEIRKFSTFQNPNSFDSYCAKVLPTSSSINYMYVTRYPIQIHSTAQHKKLVKKLHSHLNSKRKREDSLDREHKANDLDFDRLNNASPVKECFVCSWVFPDEMTTKERNIHMNRCVDGRGEEHKKNYFELRKIEELNSLPLKVVDYDECPICSKVFKVKNVKIKMRHVTDCVKHFQETDLYLSQKKRGNGH